MPDPAPYTPETYAEAVEITNACRDYSKGRCVYEELRLRIARALAVRDATLSACEAERDELLKSLDLVVASLRMAGYESDEPGSPHAYQCVDLLRARVDVAECRVTTARAALAEAVALLKEHAKWARRGDWCELRDAFIKQHEEARHD